MVVSRPDVVALVERRLQAEVVVLCHLVRRRDLVLLLRAEPFWQAHASSARQQHLLRLRLRLGLLCGSEGFIGRRFCAGASGQLVGLRGDRRAAAHLRNGGALGCGNCFGVRAAHEGKPKRAARRARWLPPDLDIGLIHLIYLGVHHLFLLQITNYLYIIDTLKSG